MTKLQRLEAWLFPDRRPEREKALERKFIRAANTLKTLSVTERGGMSIDPEEIREQIIASREQLKHFVHTPGGHNQPSKVLEGIQVNLEVTPSADAPEDSVDYMEVVAWRRLASGAAVRYVCLQSMNTGRFAVATASMLSGGTDSLPLWVDGNTNRLVATALQSNELSWFDSVCEAMNAWDAEL